MDEFESNAPDDGKHHQSQNVIVAVFLVVTSVSIGLAAGITGPAFVHLEYILNTDTQGLGLSSIGENLGYISGSIICAFSYDKINKEFQASGGYVWMGITLAIAPWMSSVNVYYFVMFVHNLAGGYLFVYLQTYLLQLMQNHKWKDSCAQGLHGMWMLGSLLCPFIVLPFLSKLPDNTTLPNCSPQMFVKENELFHNNMGTEDDSCSRNNSSLGRNEITKVRFAYITVGGMCILSTGILVLVFYITRKSKSTTHENESDPILSTHSSEVHQWTTQKKSTKALEYILYFLVSAHIGLGLVAIYVINMFLSVFVIKGLHWRTKSGPLITSVFRGANAFGALIGTPMSLYISPAIMLIIYTILTLIGLLIMAIFTDYPAVIWISCVITGIGVSTLYASMLLLGTEYINVTAKYGMVLVSVGAVATMAGGALTGSLFQHFTHMWMVYISIISIIISVVLFVLILLVGKVYKRHTLEHTKEMEQTVDINSNASVVLDTPNDIILNDYYPQPRKSYEE